MLDKQRVSFLHMKHMLFLQTCFTFYSENIVYLSSLVKIIFYFRIYDQITKQIIRLFENNQITLFSLLIIFELIKRMLYDDI
jgi:hypothetical protein